MSVEVFRVDSVSKAFGGRSVLKAASFWAWEGRITALLGRNGSGKSTLLRVAVGEVGARGGVVRYLSEAYERPRLALLARRGLYYLEERARLPNTFSIRVHLELICKKFGGQPLDEVVAGLELEDLLEKKVHECSEGEARRAALAAAVVRAPRCLLADEPFMGIAPKDEAMVAAALRDLAARGTAIVTTGHEVPALLRTADEVIWCVAGTTHGLGPPQEAQSHPEFVRDYLGWQSQG
ncbi:MAG: ATP-binding cassette domain-containing protein [Gemmatimonadota bacterium]|nr:MAG: ATP-binding cassette domain-containing protein [Gemmatimonadota bacterium]